jgi:hypothetical protein
MLVPDGAKLELARSQYVPLRSRAFLCAAIAALLLIESAVRTEVVSLPW